MKIKHTFLLLFFSLLYSGVKAQQNNDSIFQVALSQAKNNQFDQAIENGKKILKTDSKRSDVMVFLANLYSWKNQNGMALEYVLKAKRMDYKQDEFYETWTNILLRSHQYENLLAACEEAEKNKYSNIEDLLKKRMIANLELKKFSDGVSLIENPVNQKYLASKQIDGLYSDLLLKRNKNLLSAYYMLDMFDGGNNTKPQHLASLGYSFPIGDNNLGFRANYANRFGLNGVQLESDFYLKFLNKQYMYFNYGYAFNSVLFPTHRFGFEYYLPVTSNIEASIGGRYLNYPGSNVVIGTGHIAGYFGKSWLSLRPYYVYDFKSPTNTESASLILNYRLYGKTEIDYWGVELGVGNSPDQFFSNSVSNTAEFNQLSAYKIKLEKNFMIDRVSDFHIGLGYSYEEFNKNQFRNRFTVELGYKIRLK